MKSKIILFVLSVFVSVSCSKKIAPTKTVSQTNIKCIDLPNTKSDLVTQNLRGRVSAYQSTVHKAIRKSSKIEFEKVLMKNTVHETCKYDTLGNLDEYLSTYTYDHSENAVFKTKNLYNEQNQKIEEGVYKMENGKAKLVRKETYRYNINNELIETISFIGDSEIKGRAIRESDKENKTVNEMSYDAKGLLTGSISTKLDDRGNETYRDTFNPATKVHSIEKKEYDSRNNQIVYAYDGEISKFDCVFRYDDKNNEVDKKCSSSTNTRHNEYQYEYDAHCNWIKRVEFVNGIPDNVTIRILQYY